MSMSEIHVLSMALKSGRAVTMPPMSVRQLSILIRMIAN